MSDNRRSYAIVTPVRDEEEFLEETIASVRGQTEAPAAWVIVNDGSTDRTGAIIDRAAQETPWIHAVHRVDRGYRAAGSGVMEAFYGGLETLDVDDWDFLVKLDGDLKFASDYFARCLDRFATDPRLGVGGGVIYNRINGELVLERHPRFHVRGATKIYRRDCWDQIGGLYKLPGWDTLDEVSANMDGWTTLSFDDLHIEQLRYTGDADGQWRNWVKNGRANHISGYHPVYVLARAAARALRRPRFVASAGILWGYFGSPLKGIKRIEDDRLVRYLRSQQMRRLTGRKSIWM